jgi:hypothetical protein
LAIHFCFYDEERRERGRRQDGDLVRRRCELEKAKVFLEEEEVALKRLDVEEDADDGLVRLKVGGRSFDTTRETLIGSGSA